MSKKVVFTDKAPKPIGPYSQAVIANGFLFGSGQIPIDPETGEVVKGGIEEQTRRVLENIKAVLEAAGCTLEDIVSVTVFLSDLDDFQAFNKVYEEYFKDSPPARTTVEVSRLPKGVKLEVNFVAVVSKD